MVYLVYMVAGLSSRFGGKSKSFVPVGPNGESLIEISLNQALESSFDKIIFIVGEKTEQLFKEHFGNNYKGIPVEYALQKFNPDERDKPWGTCDAVVSVAHLLTDDCVVCNGDDLYGATSFAYMYECAKIYLTSGTLGYKLESVLPENGAVNRGIFKIDTNSYVQEIIETLGIEKIKLAEMNLSLNMLTSQNIFALKKEVIPLLAQQLEIFKSTHMGDRKAECYLPTELSNLIKEHKIRMVLFNAPDKWIGLTNPEDELIVKNTLARWYK